MKEYLIVAVLWNETQISKWVPAANVKEAQKIFIGSLSTKELNTLDEIGCHDSREPSRAIIPVVASASHALALLPSRSSPKPGLRAVYPATRHEELVAV